MITNIDTCSCLSSWYNKKRYKRIKTTSAWKAKSNRNPEKCTNKHSTNEKSVVKLTKFVVAISIKLIPIIYLQLLFMYNSQFVIIFILFISI